MAVLRPPFPGFAIARPKHLIVMVHLILRLDRFPYLRLRPALIEMIAQAATMTLVTMVTIVSAMAQRYAVWFDGGSAYLFFSELFQRD
jgi:hypothetical protein